MRNRFTSRTGLAAWAAFILLAAFSVDVARSQQTSTPISAVFASDAQYIWWRNGNDKSCDDKNCETQKTNDNNSALINSMNRVTNLMWPPTLANNTTTPVARPSAAVMNGDLTAYWHAEQAMGYKQTYPGFLQVPYYPGLGNHDYANNVNDCTYADGFFPDKNMCAKQAVYYMAGMIEDVKMPNLVNKDLSQYVMIENLGGFNARMIVRYTADGVTSTLTSNVTSARQYNSVILPPGSHDLDVDLQYSNGSSWNTIRHYNPSSAPGGMCYSTRGTIWSASTQVEACPRSEWPDGSYGSLSYSYDLGDYHFVQLNLTPGYDVNLPGVTVLTPYIGPFGLPAYRTPSFHVTNSWNWLKKDVAAATAAGKFIILNMHAADSAQGSRLDDYPLTDSQLMQVLNGSRVIALFSGHIHSDFGYMGAIPAAGLPIKINGQSAVPWFRSGSAECKRFLVAEFRGGYFNVGAAIADNSGPTWATSKDVCDANFAGYNQNLATTVGPASYSLSSDFALTARVAYVSPMSSGGAAVSIMGTLRDPGRDVTVTVDWTDGKTDRILVPRTSGTATFQAYHLYTTDGSPIAYVSATDGALSSEPFAVPIGQIDSKPPVTTATVSPSNGKQMLTLTATDIGSGVQEIRYLFDSATTSQQYTGPFAITPGVQTVYFWSIDRAQNMELRKSISPDTAPPVTKLTSSTVPSMYLWYNKPVTITLAATDAKSGVDKTYYSLDGGPATPYTAAFTISGEKRHSLDYWSTDRAGNWEPKNTSPIYIDVTPPVVSVQATPIASGFWSPIQISIGAMVNDALSGRDTLNATYSVMGPSSQQSGSFPLNSTNVIVSVPQIANQTYTVTVTFKDLAGNAGTATTQVTTTPMF